MKYSNVAARTPHPHLQPEPPSPPPPPTGKQHSTRFHYELSAIKQSTRSSTHAASTPAARAAITAGKLSKRSAEVRQLFSTALRLAMAGAALSKPFAVATATAGTGEGTPRLTPSFVSSLPLHFLRRLTLSGFPTACFRMCLSPRFAVLAQPCAVCAAVCAALGFLLADGTKAAGTKETAATADSCEHAWLQPRYSTETGAGSWVTSLLNCFVVCRAPERTPLRT